MAENVAKSYAGKPIDIPFILRFNQSHVLTLSDSLWIIFFVILR